MREKTWEQRKASIGSTDWVLNCKWTVSETKKKEKGQKLLILEIKKGYPITDSIDINGNKIILKSTLFPQIWLNRWNRPVPWKT